MNVIEEKDFASVGVYADDKAELKNLSEEYAAAMHLRKPVAIAQVVRYLIKEHREAEGQGNV